MSKIALHRIYYPVTSLGYGRRLGVWVQGCGRRCAGCLSPETRPRRVPDLEVEEIIRCLPAQMTPDGLTVSGGEPFDQAAAVRELVDWFRGKFNDDILIYTGYTRQELCEKHDPDVDWLLVHIAALVDGPYEQQLNDGKGLFGSRNQTLYVRRYPERYRDFAAAERKLQCVQEKDRLFWIGIPPQKEDRHED